MRVSRPQWHRWYGREELPGSIVAGAADEDAACRDNSILSVEYVVNYNEYS